MNDTEATMAARLRASGRVGGDTAVLGTLHRDATDALGAGHRLTLRIECALTAS